MKKIMTVLFAVMMLASLTVSAAAATSDFVASPESRPGPELVTTPTEDGTPAYGVIVMPDGTTIPVPEGGIVITPIRDADSATEEIKNALEESFGEVIEAESLEELIEELQDILSKIENGADVDDLLITDLFYVEILEGYEEYLNQGGKLVVTFKTTDDVIMAFSDLDGVWSAIFGDNFKDNGDGTYTLTIDQSGVYAFAKHAASVNVDSDNPGVSSPTTGDVTAVFAVLALVFAASGVVCFVIAKKQRV